MGLSTYILEVSKEFYSKKTSPVLGPNKKKHSQNTIILLMLYIFCRIDRVMYFQYKSVLRDTHKPPCPPAFMHIYLAAENCGK